MRLSDTLTGDLVELPAPPARIGMYVCGPTVYQRAHIGNARPYVVFSWLANWLRHGGYDVTFVHNITDVNDKIYEAAPEHSAERARDATQWYLDDTDAFGLGRPDVVPLATETIPEIVALIEQLVAAGHAYESDGDVYYRVASFADYGRLSGQRPDQVEEQEPNPRKEDPRDFALWKANKPYEDTSWPSPWGFGRPGWHIECSAMAAKHLGPEFWIHGGGLDLVFPHHENERAQSLAVGHPFAKVWMHNGLLRFTGEKMSKSVGNVATIQDVLAEWGRETTLLFFMTAHWRKPIDFSPETMAAADAQRRSFRAAFAVGLADPAPSLPWSDFEKALEDDFNTPEALSILHRWRADSQLGLVLEGLRVFGLHTLAQFDNPPPYVAKLAEDRLAARRTREFDEADRLRLEIDDAGWEVQDISEEPGFRLVRRG
ncbi:MAG: cysteine--tRNA ligase [Gaiellaceae bacterium]